MAKWQDAKAAPTYAAAATFVDRALAHDDSLFTPGRSIWSAAVLDDLYRRFVEHPDVSADRFEIKFHRQLDGAPQETVQLAAECLYTYFLIARNVKGDTKLPGTDPNARTS